MINIETFSSIRIMKHRDNAAPLEHMNVKFSVVFALKMMKTALLRDILL
jgi:hypothetical protein